MSSNMVKVKPPPPPPPPKKREHAQTISSSSRIPQSTPKLVASSSMKSSNKRVKGSHASNVRLLRSCAGLRDVEVYQKISKVGQGTYGSVFLGKDKVTHDVAALKMINTEQEENGFPITALREIKILKALNHDNIVSLKEIVTSKERSSDDTKTAIPKSVFMVFEYAEYDLTGILETKEIRLNQDHIKSWAFQLLEGVHYMHKQKIIHRDLKASNLLVCKNGTLKIADWGLARSWTEQMKRLTNRVITLWYRPPELLLGCSQYTPKIDMWSVGCIIAEMFRRAGFLKGSNEQHQLDLIFQVAGMPDRNDWPNIDAMCPLWKNYDPAAEASSKYKRRMKEALTQQLPNRSWMTDNAVELIDKLLTLNPDHRWSASEALDAEYFFEVPLHKKAQQLNMNFSVTSVHEWEARNKQSSIREQNRLKQQQQSQRASSSASGNYQAKARAFPGNKPPRPPPPPPPKSMHRPPPPPPPRK